MFLCESVEKRNKIAKDEKEGKVANHYYLNSWRFTVHARHYTIHTPEISVDLCQRKILCRYMMLLADDGIDAEEQTDHLLAS